MTPTTDRFSLGLRAMISLVLLAYGFFGSAPEVGQIVIGLVGGYWLREGEEQARRRTPGQASGRPPETDRP